MRAISLKKNGIKYILFLITLSLFYIILLYLLWKSRSNKKISYLSSVNEKQLLGSVWIVWQIDKISGWYHRCCGFIQLFKGTCSGVHSINVTNIFIERKFSVHLEEKNVIFEMNRSVLLHTYLIFMHNLKSILTSKLILLASILSGRLKCSEYCLTTHSEIFAKFFRDSESQKSLVSRPR